MPRITNKMNRKAYQHNIDWISDDASPKKPCDEAKDFSNLGYLKERETVRVTRKSSLTKHVEWHYMNKIDTDVIVKIGDHVSYCHITVLKCFSTHFQQYKFGDTVVLPEEKMSAETFEAVYGWMLTPDDEMERVLTATNVLGMLLAAQYLGIAMLVQQCWRHIRSLEEGDGLELYVAAKEQAVLPVVEVLLPTITKAFLPLAKSERFDRLPLEVVRELLGSNSLCVHSEVEVFVAGCKWLKADWERRQVHFAPVIQCVRFGLMAPWQLQSIRRNSSSAEFQARAGGREIHAMIEEARAYSEHRCGHGEVLPQRNWIDYTDQYDDYKTGSTPRGLFEDQQDRRAAGDRESEVNLESKMGLLSLVDVKKDSLPSQS